MNHRCADSLLARTRSVKPSSPGIGPLAAHPGDLSPLILRAPGRQGEDHGPNFRRRKIRPGVRHGQVDLEPAVLGQAALPAPLLELGAPPKVGRLAGGSPLLARHQRSVEVNLAMEEYDRAVIGYPATRAAPAEERPAVVDEVTLHLGPGVEGLRRIVVAPEGMSDPGGPHRVTFS